MKRLLLSSALALLAGCSEPPVDQPVVDLHPVKGVIRVDGVPAAGAHITLHPITNVGLGVVTPSAVAGPDGSFSVTTYQPDDGAPEGSYQVTVSWAELLSAGSEPEYGKEKLPVKFQKPDSSGLSHQVAAEKEELFVLDLTSRK